MSQAERHEPEPHEDGAASPPPTRRPDKPPVPDFWMGALIGCVLQGMIWMTVSLVMDDSVRPVDPLGRTELRDPPSATGDRPRDATRLHQCTSVAEALAGPVRAARPASDPREVHVVAMNELVTGAVTLHQASASWSQDLAARREAGCQEADPTGSAFVRPRPASSVQASADPGQRQRAGQAAGGTSAQAATSGHRPAAAADPREVAALPPAAPHPVEGTAPPAATPPSAAPPLAPPSGTPPTSGEPGPSAPPSSPPAEPTGGTPAPAPGTGTPSTDPGYPGQSGPHRRDQDHGRTPPPIGHPAPGPGPLPDTAAPNAPGLGSLEDRASTAPSG